MASLVIILINLVFTFIVFSCIYGLPSELEDEEFYNLHRNLLATKECAKYNSTFGRREARDLLVEVFKIDENKKWMTRVKHTVSYDRKKKKPNNTTLIEIINRNKDCDCYAPEIKLVDGGIHKVNGKLHFLSERNCFMNYTVNIYAR